MLRLRGCGRRSRGAEEVGGKSELPPNFRADSIRKFLCPSGRVLKKEKSLFLQMCVGTKLNRNNNQIFGNQTAKACLRIFLSGIQILTKLTIKFQVRNLGRNLSNGYTNTTTHIIVTMNRLNQRNYRYNHSMTLSFLPDNKK